MTCNDCIYRPRCIGFISYIMGEDEVTGELLTDMEKRCEHFKNKADPPEVTHGKWNRGQEPLGESDHYLVWCSACDKVWVSEDNFTYEDFVEDWHYCPCCGAKMDGGKSG